MNAGIDRAPGIRVIEVFADVVCPFTHVGLRRLIERRQAVHRGDVRLWIRAWPLELVNGEPVDPRLVDEEVRELRAQVAPDLFGDFRPTAFPHTSIPALSLVASAYDESVDLGERVSLALRWALFEEGRDISDPAVLMQLARKSGLGGPPESRLDAIIRDWRAGQGRGVLGSPHFFLDGAGFFCPSLDITRDDGHLMISVDGESLDAFLSRCFDEPAMTD